MQILFMKTFQIQSCEIPFKVFFSSFSAVSWHLISPLRELLKDELQSFAASFSDVHAFKCGEMKSIGFYLPAGNWLRKVNIGGRMCGILHCHPEKKKLAFFHRTNRIIVNKKLFFLLPSNDDLRNTINYVSTALIEHSSNNVQHLNSPVRDFPIPAPNFTGIWTINW
jgi:hypothetical protein